MKSNEGVFFQMLIYKDSTVMIVEMVERSLFAGFVQMHFFFGPFNNQYPFPRDHQTRMFFLVALCFDCHDEWTWWLEAKNTLNRIVEWRLGANPLVSPS